MKYPLLVVAVVLAAVIASVLLVCKRNDAPARRTLNLFIWTEYMLPEIKTRFEKEFNVEVIEDNYASNEEMRAKLLAGGTGYDLIIPTGYMLSYLIRDGLVLEFDHSRMPNLKNLSKKFLDPPPDKGNRFSIPFMWGTSGLGYNAELVRTPPDSWADVFETEKLELFKNRISMLDDIRETVGAALIYLGYSPNSTKPEELEKAKELLKKQKGLLSKYDSEAYGESLANKETAIAHSWSGEIITLNLEKPELQFIIPKEGVLCFQDNWCIPKGAPNKGLAEDFVNFTLRPEITAILVNYLGYVSPNEEVKPLLDPKILKTACYNIPENVKLWELEDLGESMALYEKLWTELKGE
ncbi:MAG: spermidine/putrescine ABC transporter substrate-binding protein [Planctomycetota bacterium]|nr:spermidine/putrescine ABC transporter substrate-binding protein [Planctomycetota bacterium]